VGSSVPLRTVKALLDSSALAKLECEAALWFCADATCSIVYYSSVQVFTTSDVRVEVFQKASGLNVPVCYCFGWTRGEILEDARGLEVITAHVRAGRCACDVRNPQGRCCLGNVRGLLKHEA
jgi:hypothetical protein